MKYRCVTTSVEGFVQQLACCYLRHGYWFYVQGKIPNGKCAHRIDEKIITRYGIAVSESTRYRRKKAGLANLQYIRHESTFLIMATKGQHRFYEQEANLIRDVRRVPIKFEGYSISYKRGGRKKDGSSDDKWHSHVRIDQSEYGRLNWRFHRLASTLSTLQLSIEFERIRFARYAPVQRQLCVLLNRVNRVRQSGHKDKLAVDILVKRRRPVRPFETTV